ncbi:hypothetical protein AMTRI_Chr12g274160 [Amborella trichopoda]
MVCEMGGDYLSDMEVEVLPSMWPVDLGNELGKQFNIEIPGASQELLEEVAIVEDPSVVDFKRLLELTNYSERGSSQLAYLVKQWEFKQNNAVRLLKEELDILSKQRQEVELKKLEILEAHRFEEDKYVGDKRPVSILDEGYDIWETIPRRRNEIVVQNSNFEIDSEYDSVKYWKQRAKELEKLLEESTRREQRLQDKLQENIENLARQSSPVEELSQILKRADNFLHFVLQNAPVVIGHQDKDLRYRFIYNPHPTLQEEEIIGRTDVEIFTGAGVKESQDFKKEVLERGLPAKREITFETELFGSKTFLIYVEPVFSKAGDTIGVNYMGMDITDQVIKREKMAKLREEIAVQKAKETELNKTIHITEETMRAKQMLATMSHEIRSPLSGVVSMAEILANSKLDPEQRQLLDVMLSSGDLVLQLINDILDLSKVESGVMKLEAAKFRPREVVKHVLQTAAASLQKELTLEGHITDDVPLEVIGDVLRIRQILTNLISNAVKFTHEGKVGVNLYVIPEPDCGHSGRCTQTVSDAQSSDSRKARVEDSIPAYPSNSYVEGGVSDEQPGSARIKASASLDDDKEDSLETKVWLRCDVYDTGIGIPEKALPSLFKKYMQVSADHARKYGGTGLGLAICKQLVELMGGHLTVSSQEHHGSTFTFELPCRVPLKRVHSDDTDEEISDMLDHDATMDDDEAKVGHFCFKPRTLGTLFSSGGPIARAKLLNNTINMQRSLPKETYSLPMSIHTTNDSAQVKNSCSATDTIDSSGSKFPREPMDIDNNESIIEEERKKNDQVCPQVNGCRSGSAELDALSYPSDNCSQPRQMSCSDPDNGNEKKQSCETSCKSQEHANRSLDSSGLSKAQSQAKILLVEDNKINIMVTQSMMKQLGHKIDIVNDGVEAVRAVQSCRYDLILMDVCMPIMDGLQATQLIRSFEETGNWDAAREAGVEGLPSCSGSQSSSQEALESWNRIPIIAMTANALAESVAECLANGMDSFVAKPVTFQKLKHCLQNYLSV